ncbi:MULTISPECIES: hemolysin family protein [Paeniglutamicibacter]|uniref:CBS domain containing-hemolysin-like protein n=1 Tax=Paeniglutamicibacter sulfureus TaxID=43666 RepID=A0ABU2BD65_9MICC|nr:MULTISPECIES: hemolysin family protein [Paeniglutamicibacter]MCV9993592.1 hemolysin family protein [Paeniglutamicibacter sp. ZC-3]MDO2936293.1 hemolysin family protein [Paeniglutamicibacter sulfureus]MDR7356585.1 CBS domain containing-hemolysin-like protein [Paeniglutamicibacter sulfureus]
MTAVILALSALVFILSAALLTAAESAYLYLSRQQAEALRNDYASPHLANILADSQSHTHAVRFWRIWFETASAVAVAILYLDRLGNIWLAGLLATVTMAAVSFVLVGVSPRRLGRSHADTVVRYTAPLIRFLRVVLGPIPTWLVGIGQAMSPRSVAEEDGFLSKERLRDLVDRATEGDALEDETAEIINSVFDLDDTYVRSVMVPRTEMKTIDKGEGLKAAMDLFLASGCSRVPVIGEDTDDILGIVYLKDVAYKLHLSPESTDKVEDLARRARYVPESKSVAELLPELQQESTHMAIVIDEYGGTAGLVTLEDLIEEIVGEIDDEYDRQKVDIEEVGDGSFVVRAHTSIDELGELFDIDIDEDEVDSVGGLLGKVLESVPVLGSHATFEGIEMKVLSLSGRRNRIGKILVRKETTPPTTGEQSAAKDAGHHKEQS